MAKIIVLDMGFDNEKSFVLAERLKQLRESKGLSHEKLSKALLDQYGIKISSDSLINYEVADPYHSKAYKNQGMRVEYLRCFANFYGVSTDYLLGYTNTKSNDVTVRAIVSTTGLSEENVNYLHNPDGRFENKKTDPVTLTIVHALINDLISFCSKDMLDIDHVQMMLMLSAKEKQNTQSIDSTAVSYGEAEAVVNSVGMVTLPVLDGAKFYAREMGDAITRGFIQKYIDSNPDNQ